MKGRVNTGLLTNRGASVTWGRPGNSTAEKIRSFSTSGRFDGNDLQTPLTEGFRSPEPRGYATISTATLDDAHKPSIITPAENINQIDVNIFLGNSKGAQDLEWLTSHGITHIINTAAEIPNFFPKKLRYFNLQLMDNSSPKGEDLLAVLERTYRYISGAIRFNPSVKLLVLSETQAAVAREAREAIESKTIKIKGKIVEREVKGGTVS